MATNDPFGGNGYQLPDGGWVPKDHPLAQSQTQTQQQVQQQAPQPAENPTTQNNQWWTGETDPFAAMGGGVKLPDGAWVPKSHPMAQQPGAQPGGGAGAGQGGYYGGSQSGPQPYNTTPGAQTSYMDELARRMLQPETVDPNAPQIRQQADAFSANVERQRRGAVDAAAERMGPYATGAMQGFDLMSRERAGQASGQFEAQLIGQELQTRRDQITHALDSMASMLTNDQRAALERERMNLEAELQRLGITTSANTAAAELGLRRDLGYGGLNLDAMRMLLQNQQFGDDLGLRTAQAEWGALSDLW